MNTEPAPMDIDGMIARIERAFAKVRLEDGISMKQARAKDDWKSEEDQRKDRSKDKEKSWLDIADAKIEEYCDILPFLDAKGFRFYLPAYMRWFLRHPRHGSYAADHLIYHLTPVERTKKRVVVKPAVSDRYILLNKGQRQMVCDFLELVATDARFSHNDDAKLALDHYWKK